MSKYAVSVSDYMGDDPDMFTVEAKDDKDAILQVFPDEYGEMEDGMSFDEYIDWMKNGNGDGQPYFQILNVETGKVIFG